MWKVAAWLLALAALLVAAKATSETFAVRRLAATGVRTTGTVIEVKTSHVRTESPHAGSGLSTFHVAIVQFSDEAGTTHVIESDGTAGPVVRGDRVDVLYPAAAPHDGHVLLTGLWTVPMLLYFTSVVLGAFAGCAHLMHGARAARRRPA